MKDVQKTIDNRVIRNIDYVKSREFLTDDITLLEDLEEMLVLLSVMEDKKRDSSFMREELETSIANVYVYLSGICVRLGTDLQSVMERVDKGEE